MRPHLFKSTLIVSAMSMISRVLGFIRDLLIAQIFGVNADSDAFYVAFKIPNFLRRLFAEGAFAQAFVPVLADYQQHTNSQALKLFIDKMTGSIGLILLGLTLLGTWGAPLLIWLFAPGLDSQSAQFQLAVYLLQITFPYLFFITGVALAGSILNSQGYFAIPALTPVFLNITLIIAAVWLAPLLPKPITALAWGILAAGIIQLLFPLPVLCYLKLLPACKVDFNHPGVQRVIKLLLPALFAASISQINLLLDTAFASFLISGSVSWLYYAERLVEFPLGILGIAIASVILPSLSKSYIADNPQAFSKALDWGLRWTLLIGLPATLGLVLLAEPLFAALFLRGEFSLQDVSAAAKALQGYAAGLLAFMLIKVLLPGFSARQTVRIPVYYGIYAIVANVILNSVLMIPLAHAGLALATSIAAFFNAGLLLWHLLKTNIYQPQPGWGWFICRVFIANSIVLALLFGWLNSYTVLSDNLLLRLVNIGLPVLCSMFVYVLSLKLLRLQFQELIR